MSNFLGPLDLAHQAPKSMGFSRQEYWSGLLCPSPGDLPNPGIESTSLMSPVLAGCFFTTSATWEALSHWWYSHYVISDSCNTMDGSLPGFSDHGSLQARILEWVTISFSTKPLGKPINAYIYTNTHTVEYYPAIKNEIMSFAATWMNLKIITLKSERDKYHMIPFHVASKIQHEWMYVWNKDSAHNVGDPSSITGSGRSPGEGNDYSLQYSWLENFMDRGAWQAPVHGVPKSWAQLSV